ncbi:MAG: hypothetical protein IPP87_17965 [Ideonella sp.]|nr:hypothetical protein [Ideonella sp.]
MRLGLALFRVHRRFSAVVALVLPLGAPASAADSAELAATAMRYAADGPLAASLLDFPDLRDAARSDRAVPMKLFLPGGTTAAPLVVLSHGAGGSRDANFAQARHLASHGAVLALEHPGSGTAAGRGRIGDLRDMTRDASEVLGRPRDVSFAIDQATQWNASTPQIQGRLDLTRLAVMGHSFGAYTALVACGARPARDWLVPIVAPGPGLVDGLADVRVKACVALSPQGPGAPFFTEARGGGGVGRGASRLELAPVGAAAGGLAMPSTRPRPSGSPARTPSPRAAGLPACAGRAEAADVLTEAGLRPLLRGRVDAVEVLKK